MRYRRLFSRPIVLIVAVALLTGTFAWSQLGGAAGATSGPDKITYNQQTGSNGTYIQYVPGDGSKATKQSVTSGGGCATPSPSGAPILAFSANYYPNGYANASSTAAVVGAYKSRTGVCQIPQAWSIEVRTRASIFSVGSNSLVAGREFSRAPAATRARRQVDGSDPPVSVQLVLRTGSTVVGTQNVLDPRSQRRDAARGRHRQRRSASLDRDPGACRRRPVPSRSSVPTSTFTFANKICPGETITDTSTDGTASSGQVTATFTFDRARRARASRTRSFEASSTDPTSSTLKSVHVPVAAARGRAHARDLRLGPVPVLPARRDTGPGAPGRAGLPDDHGRLRKRRSRTRRSARRTARR